MPLLLPLQDSALINSWLNPAQQDVTLFENLLIPRISSTQVITPIGKPSQWNPIGASFILESETR
jgi:hypothetical protein